VGDELQQVIINTSGLEMTVHSVGALSEGELMKFVQNLGDEAE
jgi:hypothetical protein